MVLIGNGTGIAGLRALLKARIAAGQHRNWLLFGERNAAARFPLRRRYPMPGSAMAGSQRLDLAFSRDGDRRTYVQDLPARAVATAARMARTQARRSMSAAAWRAWRRRVDAVLREAVGVEALEAMALDGRYRRDVY